MATAIVLLEDGRIGDLSVLAVKDGQRWRGRVIFQPAGGVAEIVDCPDADATFALARIRAEILAVLRFPQVPSFPGDRDQVA